MFSDQPDLFAGAAPPLRPPVSADMVSPGEEAALIAWLEQQALEPFRFQGWTGKRCTRSFGWHYDFEDGGFAQAEPIPPELLPLRERAARFAGLAPDELVQVLLTRYDPGAGIGWHRDRPVFDRVIGISLGAPAVLRLRRRTEAGFERRSLPLAPRAAYLLEGAMRTAWEHSIAPMAETRWSITFRSLSDAGKARIR
jgi:DNA oxidative demethylase